MRVQDLSFDKLPLMVRMFTGLRAMGIVFQAWALGLIGFDFFAVVVTFPI